MMHCWIEICHKSLVHNLNVLRKIAGSAPVAPVLKSNAYGHGLEVTLKVLAPLNPPWICVAYVNEAQYLRQAGYSGRILLVAPIYPEEFEAAVAAKLEVFMTDFELLEAWKRSKFRPMCHIKIDTGLTRQGFYPSQIGNLISKLHDHKSAVTGIATHFANVEDVLEHDYAKEQLLKFSDARALFKQAGYNLTQHSASSAATLLLPESRLDLCRTGISLYGFWPSSATRLSFLQIHQSVPDLKPVLTWKTHINQIKDVTPGSYIGYGCTFKATHTMRVAVLPMGYNEGYVRRIADAKSYVLIRGQRCPLVGRISMNLMVVDISHVNDANVLDEVVLIGAQGSEKISAETVADWADTIHYELLTRINESVPRKLVD